MERMTQKEREKEELKEFSERRKEMQEGISKKGERAGLHKG